LFPIDSEYIPYITGENPEMLIRQLKLSKTLGGLVILKVLSGGIFGPVSQKISHQTISRAQLTATDIEAGSKIKLPIVMKISIGLR
jgi:hypothetical protein